MFIVLFLYIICFGVDFFLAVCYIYLVIYKLRRVEPYTVFKAYFRRYRVKKPRKASALLRFLPCLDKNLDLKTA